MRTRIVAPSGLELVQELFAHPLVREDVREQLLGLQDLDAGVLHSWRLSEMTGGDAELLTSEVVTNAIVHGQSGPQLAVTVDECVVRVAVQDRSPAVPVRRLAHLDDVSGRGVVIVEEMASAWGVERARNGAKRVWFEVAC